MPDRVPLVLKVFKVELEETENDVTQLLEYYFQKLESDEITPYVWKENRALLNRELDCLKELEKDLNDWSPSSPDTSGMEALGEIKDFLHGLAEERGFPGLVTLVIDRIASKVARYIE